MVAVGEDLQLIAAVTIEDTHAEQRAIPEIAKDGHFSRVRTLQVAPGTEVPPAANAAAVQG